MHTRWAATPAAMLAAYLLSACGSSPTKPHGNPDPGGKRMAGLVSVASAVLPADASDLSHALTPSKWSQGGCDGGPAGWTYMEYVQSFQASGNVAAEIDANMQRLHWDVVPQENTEPVGQYPPSTAPGANAPYIRMYEPSRDPDSPVAWLFTPERPGGAWKLDLEAFPAEVRAADC